MSAVADIHEQLARVACDPDLDPAGRVQVLRAMRVQLGDLAGQATGQTAADLRTLAGQAETYISSNELQNSAPEKTTTAQTLALLKAEPLAHQAKPGEQSPQGTTTLTFIGPKPPEQPPAE